MIEAELIYISRVADTNGRKTMVYRAHLARQDRSATTHLIKKDFFLLGKTEPNSDDAIIITGKYRINLDTVSPKFGSRRYLEKHEWARKIKGKVPRLEHVPNHVGILIHPGLSSNASTGCLIPAASVILTTTDWLVKTEHSVDTFLSIYNEMKEREVKQILIRN